MGGAGSFVGGGEVGTAGFESGGGDGKVVSPGCAGLSSPDEFEGLTGVRKNGAAGVAASSEQACSTTGNCRQFVLSVHMFKLKDVS